MMDAIRTAVTISPRQLEIRQAAHPTVGPEQVLVRVERVGLCGSDYHFFLGDHAYSRFPLVQGHEVAGRIEALGPGVDGPLRVGERVAIEPYVSCGSCFPCRRGYPNCCADLKVLGAHIEGALADRIVVPAPLVHPVGDLDAELAALVEPISIGYRGVSRARIDAGDKVVITGAGPIGQAVLLTLQDIGATALVTDRIETRLELAQQLGAERTVPSHSDIASAVAEWTNGDGVACVIDATGAPAMIRGAVDWVGASGTIVVIGLSNDDVALPVIDFTRKELNVFGSRASQGAFPDVIELVQRNQDRVRSLITQRVPLEAAGEAMALAIERPAEVEKIIVNVEE